ncbi:hypothetical protein GOODEAATRI_033765 [Goodea atripinnis]|uniref:Uncharacterized protein n=1 Tax=Goodea atripinnis TaxID=208336 RepID=A0ABV0PJB0_9TELE
MHQPGNRAGQAKHISSAAPVRAQDRLCRPTHLTANHSPEPGQGQEPQKEALEEGHHSTPRTRHPANPTPKPRRSPRMPATHLETTYVVNWRYIKEEKRKEKEL